MAALVRSYDAYDASSGTPSSLPGGAGLFDQASKRAWVLIDDGSVGRFGPALAWALIREAASVDILVDGSVTAPGHVARRAAALSVPPAPPCRVWAVSGRSVSFAPPTDVVGPEGDPPAALVAELEAAGLEVVWEHGVLRGEVLGLEVARTVGDTLSVGVGRHDRSARLEMRPGEPVESGLVQAAEAVRALRRPGAPPHPANTLARSRWLRSVLVASPERFGFSGLRAVPPPLPWFDLPEAGAAPAVGRRTSDGNPCVVVCSAGIDLDLVPTAADCVALYGDAECAVVLAVVAGDDIPVNRRLAAALPRCSFLLMERPWA